MNPKTAAAATTLLALGLTGCTAATPIPLETPSVAPAPVPVEASTVLTKPDPIDEDATLILRALATDATGAQLALQLQIHPAQLADDVATQTLPQGIIEDCGAELTQAVLLEQGWTFTRANLSAVPTGEWSGARIDLLPSASTPLAARGILTQDPSSNPPCRADKYFSEQGRGGLAIGIAGDRDARTAWTNLRYGFTSSEGVTFSECTFEVTELGGTLRADWPLTADATTCAVG